jgi:hypothetical protein
VPGADLDEADIENACPNLFQSIQQRVLPTSQRPERNSTLRAEQCRPLPREATLRGRWTALAHAGPVDFMRSP